MEQLIRQQREPIFEQMLCYRKRGFNFISQAISCEETGCNLELAPVLYKLGIRELGRGLQACDDSSENNDLVPIQ
jgi:hypothetical protein